VLAKVPLADKRGRNPKKDSPLTITDSDVEAFIKKAQKARVLEQVEKPVLLGRDLLDVIPPGKQLGNVLKKAYEIQIEEGIVDKQELRRRVLQKVNIKD